MTIKLRAEAWGKVHERTLGSRRYKWALATLWKGGSVEIRSYSTTWKDAGAWVDSFYGRRWPEGLLEAKTVPVTEREVKPRSAKAQPGRLYLDPETGATVWDPKSL